MSTPTIVVYKRKTIWWHKTWWFFLFFKFCNSSVVSTCASRNCLFEHRYCCNAIDWNYAGCSRTGVPIVFSCNSDSGSIRWCYLSRLLLLSTTSRYKCFQRGESAVDPGFSPLQCFPVDLSGRSRHCLVTCRPAVDTVKSLFRL